ncbi:hypothetical protein HX793_22290 [Pseudomonas reactans]|uniref:hypothetical protein n=1 Tax=Pseudomonas reactans TaxID=117680 RepID=UPI0015BDFF48|nr:hypothetical protein [Pseudomonas reactans]NWA44702.1 hypothetical protein [Pseudomonas reactans]NWD32516.1 hypothetical protein [Pseudomonas reactans]
MSSLDYFARGIMRASARRKDQQSKQSVTTTTVSTTIKQSSDEQYQTAIIQLMVNHIRQKKEKQND